MLGLLLHTQQPSSFLLDSFVMYFFCGPQWPLWNTFRKLFLHMFLSGGFCLFHNLLQYVVFWVVTSLLLDPLSFCHQFSLPVEACVLNIFHVGVLGASNPDFHVHGCPPMFRVQWLCLLVRFRCWPPQLWYHARCCVANPECFYLWISIRWIGTHHAVNLPKCTDLWLP
jgi:hypothetical protein